MATPAFGNKTFQIWLNWLPAVSPKIAEDGIIGANTQRAIRQAQASAGLPQTGTITAELADYTYAYFVAATGGLNLNASLLSQLQTQATASRTAAQAGGALKLLQQSIAPNTSASGLPPYQRPKDNSGLYLLLGLGVVFVLVVAMD